MINFQTRNYDKYIVCEMGVESIWHDLGMLDETRARELLAQLEEAVDDLSSAIESNGFMLSDDDE